MEETFKVHIPSHCWVCGSSFLKVVNKHIVVCQNCGRYL